MATCLVLEPFRILIIAVLVMQGAFAFQLQLAVKTLRLKSFHQFMTVVKLTEVPETPAFPSTAKYGDVENDQWNVVEQPVVDVYPYGTPLSQIREKGAYSNVKIVHYIRHAQGAHNVNREYRSSRNMDARLTEVGLGQCRALAEQIRTATDGSSLSDLYKHTQLCVTSPLTRCIQTALHSLRPVLNLDGSAANRVKIPVLAHESIRETVNFNCDRRRNIDEIAKDFPLVDFSHVRHRHDALWEHYVARLGCDESFPHHRESAEIHKVADRCRDFLQWLGQRPEDHIVVCSHAAFSRCLWNFGQPGHVPLLPPQTLDDREPGVKNPPIVQYCGSKDFEEAMRADFDNCELRTMIFAFRAID